MPKKYQVPLAGLVLVTVLLITFVLLRFEPIIAAPAGPKVSPPTIPHTLVGWDKNCLLCHQEAGGLTPLKTPHPERGNCQQCHVPQDITQ